MPTSHYEAPRYGGESSFLHGWCLEAVQEGNAWLRAQSPARDWAGLRLALQSGTPDYGDPSDPMATGYNKTRRVSRELVAALANFRYDGEYKVRWDASRQDQAVMLTKLDRDWYRKAMVHAQIRAGLQYAVNFGTCYWTQTWAPSAYGAGRGDIQIQAYAPGDITFIQLPKSGEIQAAYGVLIRDELPINLARKICERLNPGFAAKLTPDRDSPGWLAKGLEKVQRYVSPALRVAGRTGPEHGTESAFQTVDLYYLYLLDGSINDGISPVTMGKDGTNFSYTVPYLGQMIPLPGVMNPATGAPYERPADPADCLLFPTRRLITFANAGICSDGPSPWWHGKAPVTQLKFGDWAWESLGSSLVQDVRQIQVGMEAIMNGVEDSISQRLDPPLVYDGSAVAESTAKAFNPRKGGARLRIDSPPTGMAKPVEYAMNPQFFDVPQFVLQYLQDQDRRADYVAGVADLTAMAKARQLPSADSLEKILEMAGPLVQDMIRALSVPFAELGEQRKYLYFQFYTTPRMITVQGLDGVVVDEQYKPEWFLSPEERAATDVRRASADEFYFDPSGTGLNDLHRMTQKLLFVQLQKAGFPIDPWTMADVLEIPNFGEPPAGTNTVMERYVAWQHMLAELQGEAQAEGAIAAAGAMGGAGMAQPGPGGGAPGEDGSNNTGKTGQDGAGRPASFSAPPKLVSKDGGTRSTIASSR